MKSGDKKIIIIGSIILLIGFTVIVPMLEKSDINIMEKEDPCECMNVFLDANSDDVQAEAIDQKMLRECKKDYVEYYFAEKDCFGS